MSEFSNIIFRKKKVQQHSCSSTCQNQQQFDKEKHCAFVHSDLLCMNAIVVGDCERQGWLHFATATKVRFTFRKQRISRFQTNQIITLKLGYP